MSVLLYFRRGASELPAQLLRSVVLPMALEVAWATPEELWKLEEVDEQESITLSNFHIPDGCQREVN